MTRIAAFWAGREADHDAFLATTRADRMGVRIRIGACCPLPTAKPKPKRRARRKAA